MAVQTRSTSKESHADARASRPFFSVQRAVVPSFFSESPFAVAFQPGPDAAHAEPPAGHAVQRKCADCEAEERILPQLEVGPVDDPLESEADVVADRVVRRQAVVMDQDERQARPAQAVTRLHGLGSTREAAAPRSVEQVVATAGRPLDQAVRREMEQRLDWDFSRVRVHSDAAAEQSARDVKAHAYTVGNDIVFGAGRLAPHTSAGRRLLAHELTHVVQQSGPAAKTVQREPDGSIDIGGRHDVEWKVTDDTAQVTYGRKSTTISLESQGNAAKLSQELGITKPQAATVLRDIQANAPRGKLLISFVQNKGNPRDYAIKKFREMRAGGLWNSDALARPPVEGIRRDVRVPGAGRTTLELSEYGYVFFEIKDQPFTQKPSGTAQGIQEYQHLDAAGARAPARTAPLALVRVNEYGKIVEIIEHALAGRPDAAQAKLVKEFQKASWKTDLSAAPPGSASTPVVRPPIDAHKPPDMRKQPPPMDAHKPPDVGKKPSPMDAHKPPVISPGTGTGGAPTVSRFRAAGRFLAKEAPGLALQVVFMAIFPPGVTFRQEKLSDLTGKKINPAAMDALAKQQAVFDKLFADDPVKAIYANLDVWLDYSVDASRYGDLLLDLKDMTLVNLRITRDNVSSDPKKFNQTDSLVVSKQITYSMLLYESESAARLREYQEALQRYRECLQQPGAGQGAGAEPHSHCIPPRMKPIK